jgi:hypothetical protein
MKLQSLPLAVVFAALIVSLASSQNQPTAGQGSSITNARIIEMSKLGLDDDIIIAKIKNEAANFNWRTLTSLVSKRLASHQR